MSLLEHFRKKETTRTEGTFVQVCFGVSFPVVEEPEVATWNAWNSRTGVGGRDDSGKRPLDSLVTCHVYPRSPPRGPCLKGTTYVLSHATDRSTFIPWTRPSSNGCLGWRSLSSVE